MAAALSCLSNQCYALMLLLFYLTCPSVSPAVLLSSDQAKRKGFCISHMETRWDFKKGEIKHSLLFCAVNKWPKMTRDFIANPERASLASGEYFHTVGRTGKYQHYVMSRNGGWPIFQTLVKSNYKSWLHDQSGVASSSEFRKQVCQSETRQRSMF